MKKIVLILLLSLIFVGCNTYQKKPPLAKNGILDLRNWDFEKDGNVRLDGDWEFYWKQLLNPENFKENKIRISGYFSVPGNLENYKINGINLSNDGLCTYRLKILLNDTNSVISINFNNFNSAYISYINGKKVLTVGIPSNNVNSYKGIYIKNNIIDIGNNTRKIEIILNISSFYSGDLSLESGYISIGKSDLIHKVRENKIVKMFFITGFCIFMAFYHFILFLMRPKEYANLIFSIICIFMFLMNFSSGSHFKLFSPIENYLSSYYVPKIIMFSLFELIIIFTYFLYPNEFKRKVLIFSIISYFLIIVSFAWSHTEFFLQVSEYFIFISILLFFYSIIVIVLAFRNKREGSAIFLIGFSIIMILLLEYFFNFTGLLPNGFMGSYVTFLTLLLQSLVLSVRYSNAFKKVEHQAKELTLHKEHLEELVHERTTELRIEKEKSDKLLLNVLPEKIANRLKQGETPIADHFEQVSVIFIDIADFTKLSARSKPQEMVKILNDIFTIFDKISAKYGLEKIKTIGDCYMAAAGIPVPRKDHAEAVAMFALEAMETMKGYRVLGIGDRVSVVGDSGSEPQNPIPDTQTIQFRIGLDCGPIVAGVIGEQKFIYDLWGDMVNTASRMETHGVIGKIQCTERFKEALSHRMTASHRMTFQERGEIEIKGKGMMRTYFLVKNNSNIEVQF